MSGRIWWLSSLEGNLLGLAIARALLGKPVSILLDEPLSILDYHLKRMLPQGLVGQAKNLDVAESWLTPDQVEALAVTDRLAMMSQE